MFRKTGLSEGLMLYHRWLPTWLGFERKVELKRQGMALFLNGRALCRGLIPLNGPRGTLQKQSLRPTCPFFLLGISWCHKYKSCPEVPTAAHSSAFLFGQQHVPIAAEANPQHDRYTGCTFIGFLNILSYLTMKECSPTHTVKLHRPWQASPCGSPPPGVRHPRGWLQGAWQKKHFLIISNNYCMVLGTEAQPVDALRHVLREQVAVLSSVTSHLPRIDMRTPWCLVNFLWINTSKQGGWIRQDLQCVYSGHNIIWLCCVPPIACLASTQT